MKMSENPTTNRDAVLTVVTAYPGSTALEIAALTGMPTGSASGLTSKLEQEGVLVSIGRPKQYNLAPENNPAPTTRAKTPWDPTRVARAWETVLGLKLSPADVRLALDIAERASRRNK